MLNAEPVLIVCEEGPTRNLIDTTVRRRSPQTVCCSTLAEAKTLLARRSFSVMFCRDRLPDGDFRDAVNAAKPVPSVVLSHLAEWEPCLAALRAGAFDYLSCPPAYREVERILGLALRESSQVRMTASATA